MATSRPGCPGTLHGDRTGGWRESARAGSRSATLPWKSATCTTICGGRSHGQLVAWHKSAQDVPKGSPSHAQPALKTASTHPELALDSRGAVGRNRRADRVAAGAGAVCTVPRPHGRSSVLCATTGSPGIKSSDCRKRIELRLHGVPNLLRAGRAAWTSGPRFRIGDFLRLKPTPSSQRAAELRRS